MRVSVSPENIKSILLGLCIVMQFFGFVVFLSSYTSSIAFDQTFSIFNSVLTQLAAIVIGWTILFIVWKFFNYELLKNKKIIFVLGALTIIVIFLLALFVESRGGAFRWISIGFATIQPSEFVKPIVMIVSAYFLYMTEKKNKKKEFFLWFGGYMILIFAAFYKQVDLGTMSVIALSVVLMALCARSIPIKEKVFFLLSMFVLVCGFVFFSPHTHNRFESSYKLLTNNLTEADLRGSAYHQINNLRALSYGGVFGSGLGHSVQKQKKSLPEISTDSIFALIGEELGFFGTTFIVLFFLGFSFACLYIASYVKDRFGMFVIIGITSVIVSQAYFHILVTLGAPASGIPLVFFSKGGSITVFTMMSIGLVLNIFDRSIALKKHRS